MSTEIDCFREYLQIRSISSEILQWKDAATSFLQKQAEKMGLKFTSYHFHPEAPVWILTWEGSEPQLGSLLLTSHVDVVPVFEDQWKFPPFAATVENGKIYARGAQDMKCVGMQYLLAVQRLKAAGYQPPRTIYLAFMPDEEIGGTHGMSLFCNSPEYQQMNVEFALDEGLASEDNGFSVFYGERVAWWIRIVAEGKVGHGSRFVPDTAIEKLVSFIGKALAYRAEQQTALHTQHDCGKTLGDVPSLNLTMLKGGVAYNVVPGEFEAGFDFRIPPTYDLQQFLKDTIEKWCAESGVRYEFVKPELMRHAATALTEENKWWVAFRDLFKEHGVVLKQEIFSAATDSRYLRLLGLPVLGFSPMRNTPILLHDHNEFIDESVFLEGVDWYTKVLRRLAEQK